VLGMIKHRRLHPKAEAYAMPYSQNVVVAMLQAKV